MSDGEKLLKMVVKQDAEFERFSTAWEERAAAFGDLFLEAARERLQFINANREKLVEAFLAETGCLPSEAEIIEQDHGGGKLSIRVQRRATRT